ncbi:MAG: dihydrofolate reductase family protein [Chitinophagaceae bacterium]
MRKLIVFNMLTSDGYYKGQNEDISWHKVDKEINEFIIEQTKTTDTLLFGKKTYKVMEDFWPTKEAHQQDPEIASMMSEYLKIICSTTLEKTNWTNTKLIKENIKDEVKKLKDQQGKDMFIFGSGELCKTLIQYHLIDEFRLMIHPVALGKGEPFFHSRLDLQLLKTKVFGNGNVLLYYRPVNGTY